MTAARTGIGYAVRTLRKSPGFTLAVVLSLALGIGANTAIYSVVNSLLFHPAGVADPGRLIAPRVDYKKLNLDKIGMSATDFADIREDRAVFSKAALLDVEDFNYAGTGSAERLQAGLVSWQWFDVFGAKPLLGRGFHAEEDQPGANHVVVLSYAAWQRLFGGDRAVIGRSLDLNKAPYRVVGVMPRDFRWPAEADLWMPIGLAAGEYGPDNRFNENYFVAARLAPGVTYERAVASVQALSNRVLDVVPYARGAQWSMVIEPFTEYTAGNLKRPIFLLLGAVALVLLIACSNIAGLLLVRGTGRARELAIRTALGANRGDLIGQALAESFVLGAAGTLAGLLLAYGILRGLLALAQVQLGTTLVVAIDAHVLLFAVCAGVISALLFGLVPAWNTSRLGQSYDQLKEGSRSQTEGAHRQTLRSALVAGQIALALILLVGAGLLFQTLSNLRNVKAGFDPRGTMTASIALPSPEYKDNEKRAAFYRTVIDHLEQTPGISAAAAVNVVPFSGGWGDPTASFSIEGRVQTPGDPGFHGSSRYTTPEYFKALQIPLIAGRVFNDGDTARGEPVAIIDTALAQRYWPNQNPLGQRLRRSGAWARIVGIVGHVKQASLAADTGRGAYYFCLYQQPMADTFLVVRGRLRETELARAIREAVRNADPAQAVFDFASMPERISRALGPQQFAARLLMIFAASALLLAALGLYGVISYSVARRTREIGIRSALGAERSSILALIIGQAMRLVAVGIVAGVAGAALLGRIASAQLFGVSALDPATFAVTAIILSAAGLLASLVPAWRAVRVDPITALRNE
ncbi:MAG TPA: ABC transporter permease [Bryobacteraceae bacterium]|jgi:predicted permease|nr:ABC transporter permease [Bryobacteraceae bacterium]